MENVGAAASEMLKRRVRHAYRLAWVSVAVLLLPVSDALALSTRIVLRDRGPAEAQGAGGSRLRAGHAAPRVRRRTG